MRVEDALYHAVHDYPGGAQALAPRMGVSGSTLQNMADPRQPNHTWPLRRFQQVVALTGDTRPVQALCAENGGVFVPTTRLSESSVPELFRAVSKLAAEFGDVVREIENDMADGRITPRERDMIQKQLNELIEAAAVLGKRIDVDARPVALRVAQ